MALQHDLIGFFRVRPVRFQIMMAAQLLVIVGRGSLKRQYFFPPVHNAFIFGKETMPADIHAVPVVFHCTGDAAEFFCGFKDGHIISI